MCVSMYVGMYVCAYVCMYTCVYVWMWACATDVHTCVGAFINLDLCSFPKPLTPKPETLNSKPQTIIVTSIM